MVADRRLKSFLGVHVGLELTVEVSLLRDGVFWNLCDRGGHVAGKSDYHVSLLCLQIFCPRPRYIKFYPWHTIRCGNRVLTSDTESIDSVCEMHQSEEVDDNESA
jgi:hypothetical protein